jgi:hypothetical protein
MPLTRCMSALIVAVLLLSAVTVDAQEPMPYGPAITLEQAKKAMAGAEARPRRTTGPWSSQSWTPAATW